MRVNNALSADEVDDGWVLTCQAIPTSREVVVNYDAVIRSGRARPSELVGVLVQARRHAVLRPRAVEADRVADHAQRPVGGVDRHDHAARTHELAVERVAELRHRARPGSRAGAAAPPTPPPMPP